MQNTTDGPVDVQSLAVRANGRTLLAFAGAELAAVITTARSHKSTLASGEGATVLLDLVLTARPPRPAGACAPVDGARNLPSGESNTYTFDAARRPARQRPARAVAAPLRGGPDLNFNGCCGVSPHRTALEAVDGTLHDFQRFAVDLIRIDNQGRVNQRTGA